MKRQLENHKRLDWIGPLLIFIPAMSIASIYGGYAETLQLPTAWLAQASHILMLFLVAISFVISAPKLATTVWWVGLACIAYAPLLVVIGSAQISLSRPLTHSESEEFRHEFPVPVLFYSSGEDDCIRVRRHDFSEAMRLHIQGIGALIERSNKQNQPQQTPKGESGTRD